MTDLMQKALATVSNWTAEQQDEAAHMLLALDRLGAGACQAGADELRCIDQALAEIERGEVATDAEVAAAYARFRR
jgi:hypothetical protein